MSTAMKSTSLLIIFLLIVVTSCGRTPRSTTILWQGEGGVEGASWNIDGKYAGKGLEGYKAVLKKLGSLPDHGLVQVQYSFPDWNETTVGYDSNDYLPFKGRNDLRAEFGKVIQEKDLGVRMHALNTDPRANQSK